MSEQLFQIGIKAIIRNDQGKVLVIGFRWKDNPQLNWDLPGGRMDPGESFEQTLSRELHEELGVRHDGEAQHVMTVLSNHTIQVGDKRVPLALIAYDVRLDPDQMPRAAEADSVIEWCAPSEAAKRLEAKFPPEFCIYIANL